MFNVRPPVWEMDFHLTLAGDAFDGVLLSAVIFPTSCLGMRCGTEVSQFLGIFLPILEFMHVALPCYPTPRAGKKSSETDSIKSQISSKTSRGKTDSTKIRHERHHPRQPGEQLLPIQVATG